MGNATMLMKHRDELDVFEIDFSRRLGGGESISVVQSVKVSKNAGMHWEDVTTAFVDADQTSIIDARVVSFTLIAANPPSSQRVGEYTVYVRAETSQGRLIVATAPLFIIRAAGA